MWPAVPLELLEQRYEAVKWFDFYWDAIGPTSWISNLYLLRREWRSSLVCLLNEEEPLFLLGLVESHDNRLLLSRLFTRLIDRNGKHFGVNVFGSLPTETTNWLPHLVDERVIKQAYWDWLEWAEPAQFDSWLDLEQSLALYDLEPNPMKRSLAVLSGLPNLTEPTAVADWLDEHDQESAGLPDHSKQAILDWYFRRRYVTDSVR